MRARVAVFVASLAAAPVSWPAAADGLPQLRTSPSREPGPTVPDLTSRTPGVPPPAAWDTFSADLTIRRQLLRRDGTVHLHGPEMRYRWSRILTDRGWQTAMTLVSSSPDTIQTAKGPQAVSRKIPVSRIEIGDPQTPTRVFDADGRMAFLLPSQAPPPRPGTATTNTRPDDPAATAMAEAIAAAVALPASAGASEAPPSAARSREWIEQLMPTRAASVARRAALIRSMGAPHGLEGGLERFLGNADGETTEILTDPAWGLPVEINVMRNGALVSHTTFGYAEDPGAGRIRRRMRSEHLLSPESGDRSVVDMELSNIRLDRGGAR
jgi:hypothetical protein